MARKRYKPEEIVSLLRQAEVLRTPPVKTAPPVSCIRHDFGDRRRAGGVVVGGWRAARG